MFRRVGLGAAAVCAAGLIAAGCSDDGDTIMAGGSMVPSNFPGTEITANTNSADGFAFNQPTGYGQFYNVQVWTDVNSHRAILTFNDDNDALWASYNSGGGVFTPPVEIGVLRRGDVCEVMNVVFLNTAGNADAVTAQRNGDAIILFETQQDGLTTNTNGDDDDTWGVFSAYFNADVMGQAFASVGAVDFSYGFQRIASRVDDDPDSGTENQLDVYGSTSGLVSDSIWGSHANNSGARSSGQSTSFVAAVWFQQLNDGDNGQHLYKVFPLSTADTFGFTGTADTDLTIASVDHQGTEEADDGWMAHNGYLFMSTGGNSGTDDNDDVIVASVFRNGSFTSPAEVSRDDDNNGDAVTLPDVDSDNLYGPDHGMGHCALFYTEAGYDGSTAGGEENADTDLFVATIDDTGTSLAIATAQIDLHGDLFSNGSANYTGSSSVSSLRTDMARDGSYVIAAFVQPHEDDDTQISNTNNTVACAVVYDTSLLADATGPAAVSNVLILTDDVDGTNTQNVANLTLQSELGYVCGIQSDLDIFSVGFTQHDGTDMERLYVNTVIVTLAAGTTDPAIASDSGGDILVADQHEDWGGYDFEIFDSGTDGLPVVIFAGQANSHEGDNATSNSFGETRLFAWVDGVHGADLDQNDDTNVIGSQGATSHEQEFDGDVEVRTTPRPGKGQITGNYAGSHLQVVFTEERLSGWGYNDIMHTALNKANTGLATPTATWSTVTRVSYDFSGYPQLEEVMTNGSSVDVYFSLQGDNGDHLHFNTASYGSVGAPTLIDNDFWATAQDYWFFADEDGTAGSCDDGPGALTIWEKNIERDDFNGTNETRMNLRVRN